MSRTRTTCMPIGYKLRSEKYLYQASDSEIRADLEKLNYFTQPKKIPEEVVVETVLPKKREAPIEDLDYVVDGLVKLMTFKPKDQKKKPPVIVEKKPEPPAPPKPSPPPTPSIPPMPSMFPYFSLPHNYGMSDMSIFTNPFMYAGFGMNSLIRIRSSADYHLKLARYIQTHKLTVNHSI
ncbi:hypothetical protein SteCoe_22758 [Stentor coeruleus]|uniref:Uncharacterized protein n=1 Tax=Stentor coeruleus TaxID=5963 RepID=A0A1R2BLK8_9CILI|nr:hypothetical protein SteCoe_22758 [Stentor coeruleus]